MHILLIFIDGIGIGADDSAVNPFSIAEMPTLTGLTNGRRWVDGIGTQQSDRALFIPTDPRLGVPGRPQSGTGHATIITGKNVPALIGRHYGPKPNAATREIVSEGTFFNEVVDAGKQAALISAYPPGLHYDIERGKRLPSCYQQAVLQMGLPMFGVDDLLAGRAVSEDWTGEGWRNHLGFADVPVYSPEEAGVKMMQVARGYDFAFFSHWMTDIVGHRGPFERGVALLERFDRVMAGALDVLDDDGLIIVTSDHGNMENLGIRQHTENDVPTLVIGREKERFAEDFSALTDIVPGMRRVLFGD